MTVVTLYYHQIFKCEAVNIFPGQFYVTDQDILICTILGSCVAACIRDRISGIGGMNHFILPFIGSDPNNPASESARYGAYAMESLVNEVIKLGAIRKNLEAKVFGGGNVSRNYTNFNIGKNNVNFVREYLRNEGIRITAEDLADIQGRKVYFFPRSGKVFVKKMAIITPSILNIEKEYTDSMKVETLSDKIDSL